jgi:ketosteroid isomerase-like protein
MKRCFLLILMMHVVFAAFTQDADKNEILKILKDQTLYWNKGDLDNFMNGYWHNDSLMFVGKSSVTYGYKNTLKHYKETYSDADKMGKLFFEILKVKKLSDDYYFVLGKWFLKRNAGDVGGHYTLLVRKIKGKWMIVSDHSS